MIESHIVTCFVLRRQAGEPDRVLLLQRSDQAETYQQRWAAATTLIKTSPDEQAWSELGEALGLDRNDALLLARGPVVDAPDHELGRAWIIHPYLFLVLHEGKIRLGREHSRLVWVRPDELDSYSTMPRLFAALEAVYPGTDVEHNIGGPSEGIPG